MLRYVINLHFTPLYSTFLIIVNNFCFIEGVRDKKMPRFLGHFRGFCGVSGGFAGICGISEDFEGFRRVLRGFEVFCGVSQGFAGFQRVLRGFAEF
jgi:hypothetical protein